MTSVIIIGHGKYGSMIKESLKMLVGDVKNFYYIDFEAQDNLDILKEKINNIAKKLNNILFVTDISGGTPFRESCIFASTHPNSIVIGGINLTSICEISYNLNIEIRDLVKLAEEVTKESIMIYNNTKE